MNARILAERAGVRAACGIAARPGGGLARPPTLRAVPVSATAAQLCGELFGIKKRRLGAGVWHSIE